MTPLQLAILSCLTGGPLYHTDLCRALEERLGKKPRTPGIFTALGPLVDGALVVAALSLREHEDALLHQRTYSLTPKGHQVVTGAPSKR